MNDSDALIETLSEMRSVALRTLARREAHRAEIEAKLTKKYGGLPDFQSHCKSVLDELEQDGSLNSRRYLTAFIRTEIKKRRGLLRILHELRSKGIPFYETDVKSIYAEESPPEEVKGAIQLLLERKFPQYREDLKTRSRAMNALMRRGYPPDLVREALSSKGDQNLRR